MTITISKALIILAAVLLFLAVLSAMGALGLSVWVLVLFAACAWMIAQLGL